MSGAKTSPEHAPARDMPAIETPALIWDLDVLTERANALKAFADAHGCTLLYSLKASGVGAVLKRIAPHVAGFACSSPFEAQLSRNVLGAAGSVHLTSPALDLRDAAAVNGSCDHVTYNSLGQWRRLQGSMSPAIRTGLRINPQHSIVEDPRYDPCRPGSKLGIPLPDLAKAFAEAPDTFAALDGLHIHTACGNRSFRGLQETVDRIIDAVPELLRSVNWFNLGGGYAFDKIRKTGPFDASISRLREEFGLQVFIEPGTAMVQTAGRIVTAVTDVIDTEPAPVAVLDTSVNHMPEVFAYQFQPPVREARGNGPHRYVLAGATCLAGDILGTYGFAKPLRVGDRLTVNRMGAYTHGQSHWFNGVNLPAIYTESRDGGLSLERAFAFADFTDRCAATSFTG